MRDWHEALKQKLNSLGTRKKPWGNQRCLEQFWDKMDRHGKIRFDDLKHCSECVSTVRWLRKRKEVRLTQDGFLKKESPPQR